MKKIKNIKKNAGNFIIIIMFISAILFMTVGFAAYGKTVNIGGTAKLKPDGTIYISNVSVVPNSLKHATADPDWTAHNIDFNLTFTTTQNQASANDYGAEFNVTMVNDSSYDYVYSAPDYTPRINRKSNNASIDSSYLGYRTDGIKTGDVIPSKTSITFKIIFTFTNPLSRDTDTFIIDGDFAPTVTEDTSASLYASVDESIEGNLRGNNTMAAYTITVTNTYNVRKSFSITIGTDKFDVKDENLNNNIEYSIDANTTEEIFTFYIVKKQGTEHITNTERVSVFVNTDGQEQINAGRITVLVDQNSSYDDLNAPIISNVNAVISDTEGSVDLSWTGRDDESYPTNYTVIVYKDENELRRVTTADDAPKITITGLAEGTYSFTVVGTDAFGNTATETEITNATIAEGHACKISNITAKWRYTVTFRLSNMKTKSQETAIRGTDYTTRIEASSGYYLPGSITITVGRTTLSQNGYEYDSDTGNIKIFGSYITDNITITATANSGGCLLEGTKILLADGTYKNIEDIKYWDLLKVYDHVNGGMTDVYPIWIEQPGTSNSYVKIEFDDGNILKVVNHHSLFDVDKRKYVDVEDKNEFGIGSRVYEIIDNKLKIVKVTNMEIVEEQVKYYNVVSTGYYNIIANNLLTTDTTSSISNIYGFNDNAIYSENYYKISKEKGLEYKDISFIPHYLYKGLNLRNALSLINKALNTNFLNSFVSSNTLPQINRNGENYFIVTTSEDKVDMQNIEKNLYKENSIYKIPIKGPAYYIETSTNKIYKAGEKITVTNSIHLKAI